MEGCNLSKVQDHRIFCRVSEDERTVIWCIANQNNFLLGVQILVFMTLFSYVIYNLDKVCVVIIVQSVFVLNLFSVGGL